MKSIFEAFVCTTVKIIVTTINAQLKTFPSKIKLDEYGMVLDYSLLENPKVPITKDAVEANLKGAVYVKTPPFFPFSPQTILSNVTDSASMLEFHVTAYALNTLLYTGHQQNLLKFSATPQFLSTSSADVLRLT